MIHSSKKREGWTPDTNVVAIRANEFKYKTWHAIVMRGYKLKERRCSHRLKNGDVNTVKFFKELFGRQTCCVQGNRRYWLWELPGFDLYVANGWGFDINVPPNATYDEVMAARRFLNSKIENS